MFPLGNIEDDPLKKLLVAFLIAHPRGLVPAPRIPAVLGSDPVFTLERHAQPATTRPFLQHSLPILRVKLVLDPPGIVHPFLRRKPEHRLDLRADIVPAALFLRIGDVDDCGQLFDEGAKLRLRLFQRRLDPAPFGNFTLQRFVRGPQFARPRLHRLLQQVARVFDRLLRSFAHADVPDDHDALLVRQGQRTRLVLLDLPVDRKGIFDADGLPAFPQTFDDALKLNAHLRKGDVLDLPTHHLLDREAVPALAPILEVEYLSVPIDQKKEIRKGVEDRLHLRIGLNEFMGTKVEGPLEHLAVIVELIVSLPDRIDKLPQFRGNVIDFPAVLVDLSFEKAVHEISPGAVRPAFQDKVHSSESVVMVMV